MKRVLAVIAILLFPLFLSAQTETIYFDTSWKVTDRLHASYYRQVTRQPDRKYKVEDYYMTGKIQMTGSYKWLTPARDSGTEDGAFVYYDSLGFVEKAGRVINNKSTGTWIFNYEHSKILAEEHRFINDSTFICVGFGEISHKRRFEGKAILSETDGWQKSGVWKYYYRDGKTTSEVAHFQWDRKNGLSIFYDSTSHKITEEGVYRFDKKWFPWKVYYPGTSILKKHYYITNDSGYVTRHYAEYDEKGKITKQEVLNHKPSPGPRYQNVRMGDSVFSVQIIE